MKLHALPAIIIASLFVLVSLLEACVLSWRQRRRAQRFDWAEVAISFIDLVVRKLIDLLPFSIVLPVFALAWHHRIHTVKFPGLTLVVLIFIGQEFCYYWYHRSAHRVRLFWASHVVHHSPQQLSLSAAYRLGLTSKLSGSGLFFTPLVWLGVRPELVIAMVSINLWYQFWIHTTWIPKLGWFEYVFNTPSAHRVHHASNVEYLDCNYGGALIVFDRLFGTYVPERTDLPCRYGLATPLRSRNPFVIEFQQWVELARDITAARHPWQALSYLWRPPGWRGARHSPRQLNQESPARPASLTEPATLASRDSTFPRG